MSELALVSLRGVSFSYALPGGGSRPALADVSLEAYAGETLVVLGAGGAGKSTLAAVLAGVEAPVVGRVERRPPPDGPAELPAGFVTQNPEDCFSSPLVREEMGIVLENLEREPAEIDRAVDEALADTGLADHADAHPVSLSGGQKQLLAIASVLIARPPLLVLDEPLTLLDAPGRTEVDRLLARATGPETAVVYLTSEVEEAARGARVVVLHRGAIVWEGPSADLPRDAATLERWDLVPPEPQPEAVLAEGLCGVGLPDGAQLRAGTHGGAERQDPGACAGKPVSPPPGDASPSIAVQDLHFSYDRGTPRERPVLRGVDLEACPGELLGIVGAIGSGKTTLIQHLNGLLLPQRGTVRVGERVLRPDTRLKRLLHREVGLVFQFPEKQLFAETVDEDVAAGPDFAGVPADEIPALVRAALALVGLDPAEDGPRAPFALTWGEKRLVAIAGVLALRTPCLVLDEPGAGLDPRARRRVMALLADLAHREGRTVVVVSHHLAELRRAADRVALLEAGRITRVEATPRRPPLRS